jgi:hypothetical protein
MDSTQDTVISPTNSLQARKDEDSGDWGSTPHTSIIAPDGHISGIIVPRSNFAIDIDFDLYRTTRVKEESRSLK